MATTDEVIAKCQEAAAAADDCECDDLAEALRSAVSNLEGLKPLLDK